MARGRTDDVPERVAGHVDEDRDLDQLLLWQRQGAAAPTGRSQRNHDDHREPLPPEVDQIPGAVDVGIGPGAVPEIERQHPDRDQRRRGDDSVDGNRPPFGNPHGWRPGEQQHPGDQQRHPHQQRPRLESMVHGRRTRCGHQIPDRLAEVEARQTDAQQQPPGTASANFSTSSVKCGDEDRHTRHGHPHADQCSRDQRSQLLVDERGANAQRHHDRRSRQKSPNQASKCGSRREQCRLSDGHRSPLP